MKEFGIRIKQVQRETVEKLIKLIKENTMQTEKDTGNVRLWEVEHSYYCEEVNYYFSDSTFHYNSWGDFLEEMEEIDIDLNLLFRWDWYEDEEKEHIDDYYRDGKLKLFWMAQRKGRFFSSIVDVCRADEPSVIEYLTPRYKHMLKLWEPLGQRIGLMDKDVK